MSFVAKIVSNSPLSSRRNLSNSGRKSHGSRDGSPLAPKELHDSSGVPRLSMGAPGSPGSLSPQAQTPPSLSPLGDRPPPSRDGSSDSLPPVLIESVAPTYNSASRGSSPVTPVISSFDSTEAPPRPMGARMPSLRVETGASGVLHGKPASPKEGPAPSPKEGPAVPPSSHRSIFRRSSRSSTSIGGAVSASPPAVAAPSSPPATPSFLLAATNSRDGVAADEVDAVLVPPRPPRQRLTSEVEFAAIRLDSRAVRGRNHSEVEASAIPDCNSYGGFPGGSVLGAAIAAANAHAVASPFGGDVNGSGLGIGATISIPDRPPPRRIALPSHKKTGEVAGRLLETLQRIDAFHTLTPSLQRLAVEAMEPHRVKKGDVVIASKSELNFLYIIESGTFRTFSNRVDENCELSCDEMGPGDFFSEAALYATPDGDRLEAHGFNVECTSEKGHGGLYRLASNHFIEVRARLLEERDTMSLSTFLTQTLGAMARMDAARQAERADCAEDSIAEDADALGGDSFRDEPSLREPTSSALRDPSSSPSLTGLPPKRVSFVGGSSTGPAEEESAFAADAARMTLKLGAKAALKFVSVTELFSHASNTCSGEEIFLIKAGELSVTLKRADDRLDQREMRYAPGDFLPCASIRSWSECKLEANLTSAHLSCLLVPASLRTSLPVPFAREMIRQYQRKVLGGVNAFLGFSEGNLDAMLEAGTPMSFKPGEAIFREGQPAGYNCLFIVLRGTARAFRAKNQKELQKESEVLEQRAALVEQHQRARGATSRDGSPITNGPVFRSASATAAFTTSAGTSGTASPTSPLRPDENTPISFSQKARRPSCDTLEMRPGSFPGAQRHPPSVDPSFSSPDLTLGHFGVADHFGASTILDGESSTRSISITASSVLDTIALPRDAFGALLPRVTVSLKRQLVHRQWLINRGKIELSDLKKGQLLGVGSFGRVRMGIHLSGKPFAVKVVDKLKLNASAGLIEQTIHERSLLATCNHPFLLRLVSAHQSKNHIYFITELVLGGELYTQLQVKKKFGMPAARFYASCVLAAFTYLSHINVAYRDLKPENLLVEADGYLKVIDFGFAKIIDGRTFTFCGTPDYMAPEIIMFHGQTVRADACLEPRAGRQVVPLVAYP